MSREELLSALARFRSLTAEPRAIGLALMRRRDLMRGEPLAAEGVPSASFFIGWSGAATAALPRW